MKRRIAAMFIVMLILAVTMSMEVLGTTQINNSSQFFKWLSDTGTPSYSVSGSYMANYGTYRDYGLIVYGSPLDIP